MGVADIFSKDQTNMVWDDKVRSFRAVTADLVYTFRRKTDSPCTASN